MTDLRGPQRPTPGFQAWAVFAPGDVVRCPADHPRRPGTRCDAQLATHHQAGVAKVRLHPGTTPPRVQDVDPLALVLKCWRCGTYCEVKVVDARQAAA